ncbi:MULTISPECIES: SpoIIE family protein phosphatase [Protofrankia]|uniref:Putative PAS/PAC sensor protein n=1 Tax=Candidatus Protofrankia datiscae TaxID=2716812 RepID=F8B639_9ACTN|nr:MULTISPECIES: SpoIIE family protein phosphatase [Protofrankia]AEH10247.1 putative PAS/PAC sensor protein [Candidatus Protofrankia datiscae]
MGSGGDDRPRLHRHANDLPAPPGSDGGGPARVLLALDTAGVGIWEWDVAANRLRWDQRTADLHGVELGSFAGTAEAFFSCVHPSDLPFLRARMDTVLATGESFLEEFRVVRPDGSPVWLQVRGGIVGDDAGRVVRVTGICTDATGLRAGREQAGRALQQVSDGVLVFDNDSRFVFVNTVMSRLLGCDTCEPVGEQFLDLEPSLMGPAFEKLYLQALDTQLPVESEADYAAFGGHFEVRLFPSPEGITAYFRNVDERRRAEAHRAALITSLSSALGRARQLFDVTAALGQALTVPDVADVIVRSAWDDLGADCAIIMLVGDEGRVRVVTPTVQSERISRLLELISARGTAATPDVLRTARARFDSRAEHLADYPHARSLLEAAAVAWIAHIPLIVSGKPIGVIVLLWESERVFDADERAFLTTLAGHCAHALERVRLYEKQLSVSEALQRAILPQRLPELAGVELAARYLPAGRDVDVGGDWYDALVLPTGELTLIVGDVGGHGLRAATVMAELRHAARAYALLSHPPAMITSQLSSNLAASDSAVYATAVVACLDMAEKTLTWSCAGHPPPLLLDGDCPAFLEVVHGPILGAVDNLAYRQDTVTLPTRARLLLYSDGLVERRDASITDRLAVLATVAAQSDTLSLDALCDRLLTEVAGPSGREDDLCLLAADIHGPGSRTRTPTG